MKYRSSVFYKSRNVWNKCGNDYWWWEKFKKTYIWRGNSLIWAHQIVHAFLQLGILPEAMDTYWDGWLKNAVNDGPKM